MAQRVAQRAQRVPVSPVAGGWWAKVKKIIACTVVLGVFLTGIGACMLAGMLTEQRKMLPPVGDLKARAQSSGTKIFTHDGQLLAEFSTEHREWIPLKDIPEVLKKATIAIEDERFYKHPGTDLIGIARALVQNVRHHEIKQGGSTIPEQLAKVIYLTSKRTMSRRVTQMLLALEIEKKYTKEEILEMYLNKIYYGSGAYGVQAASKLYFNKDASQLTVAEAAMIAAIPKSPERFSPFEEPLERHQEAVRDRRNIVIQKMAEQRMVTQQEAEHARDSVLTLARPRLFGNRHFRAPHFAMYVKQLLNRNYSDEELRSGGFQVYTTLDMDMQIAATHAIHSGLNTAEARNASQAALVCIDPRTGHIMAMVGGRDFYDRAPEHHAQLNRAVQSHRQPGSSFKVYDYTAAMELLGKTPDSTVSDSPVSIISGGKNWSPKNYDGKYKGAMAYHTAFAFSRNVPAVKVAREVGIENVIKTAHAMGIHSHLEPYLPVALGANGLTVLEHTSAVGVIAAGGVRAEPTAIERIVRGNGEVVWAHGHGSLPRIISLDTAEKMQEMMQGVVEHGTGTRARIEGVRVCGKTGTTNKHADVWFVGFTPNLVAAIWMGNDDPNKEMYKGTTGGVFVAPIWKMFMEKAHKIYEEKKMGSGIPVEQSAENPEKVETEQKKPERKQVVLRICDESGLVARSGCPQTHRQKFDPDERPTEKCDLHEDAPALITVTLCQESGMLATEFCEHKITERMAREDAPRAKCDLHAAKPTPENTEPPPANGNGQ